MLFPSLCFWSAPYVLRSVHKSVVMWESWFLASISASRQCCCSVALLLSVSQHRWLQQQQHIALKPWLACSLACRRLRCCCLMSFVTVCQATGVSTWLFITFMYVWECVCVVSNLRVPCLQVHAPCRAQFQASSSHLRGNSSTSSADERGLTPVKHRLVMVSVWLSLS